MLRVRYVLSYVYFINNRIKLNSTFNENKPVLERND